MSRLDRFLLWLAGPALHRQRLTEAKRRWTPNIACGFSPCDEQAVHYVVWGSDKRQASNTCEHHMKQLWEECQPLVAQGRLYWIQQMPRQETT